MMRYLGFILLAFSPAILAGTANTSFTVSATVNDSCTVSVAGGTLAFGSYDPTTGAVLDSTTSLFTTCTNLTGYNIGLDQGAGSGATIATRVMTSSSNTINYSLYQDASHSTVWGDTIGTNTIANTGTGVQQTTTIYGRIFASQTSVPAGSYSDTINVTVTF